MEVIIAICPNVLFGGTFSMNYITNEQNYSNGYNNKKLCHSFDDLTKNPSTPNAQ